MASVYLASPDGASASVIRHQVIAGAISSWDANLAHDAFQRRSVSFGPVCDLTHLSGAGFAPSDLDLLASGDE